MNLDRSGFELDFCDDFTSAELDRSRWLPVYLPQWSNSTLSAARHEIRDGRLRLLIEADQQPWSPEHNGPLRVSNLQTGLFSGPVGSPIGQHQFTPGLQVSEAQQTERLYTPLYGIVEARVAAIADPACMVALWMIGFEDQPHRSAEICIFEIFGAEITADTALVGVGLHPFGDGRIREDFRKVTVSMDAREFHTYSVHWLPGEVRFYVDDVFIASMDQAPDYPMQLMLNVYEFEETDAADYPKAFAVDWVRGYRPAS